MSIQTLSSPQLKQHYEPWRLQCKAVKKPKRKLAIGIEQALLHCDSNASSLTKTAFQLFFELEYNTVLSMVGCTPGCVPLI